MNPTTSFINLDYLRLMAGEDEEMVQTMLDMLLEELPEEFGKIKTLNESKDWDELRELSHKMKSTLAFVGNKEMTEANQEIERLAKSHRDQHKIGELIDVMEQFYPFVMQELKQACQTC